MTPPRAAPELVYQGSDGVLRWSADDREVALFGANYCLPSACDYRAAGAVGADRKTLIAQDMAHFARLGWDGLRLSFWGDWENSDLHGNLVVNDHLDLLCCLIAEATARGIFMLLSPIVNHSSLWPDLSDDPAAAGFGRHFSRPALGTDADAIAAQANYWRQLLRHVNPYSGHALKDEPHILFLETINEPAHHSRDFDGSVEYIDALGDAIRSTGCEKLVFHNVSQDFRMAKAIRTSKAHGSTFAWYPSGLLSGREQRGNFLRAVDDYPPMRDPDLANKAKLVYEFDMADVSGACHYPAMVRAFRSVGAQFATMFSYDMLATAPFNLGWQTHCLNLVHTPRKAASAIIAGEAMRRLPRGGQYGPYPENTRFGDFRVCYDENRSEMVSAESYLYAGDTDTPPPAPGSLRRIVGVGSSPLVRYEGCGLYFLDKVEDGIWRLEVYPDAVPVADPFAPPRADRTVFRLIHRLRPMQVCLPDLGDTFRIAPLNEGNEHAAQAENGRFVAAPGVFLLTASGRETDEIPLPDTVNGIGLREFVCPAPIPSAASGAPDVIVTSGDEHPADQPLRIRATIADGSVPESVTLCLPVSGAAGSTRKFPMTPLGGYDYEAVVPAVDIGAAGTLEYALRIQRGNGNGMFRFPHGFLTCRVVAPRSPLLLFDPVRDASALALSRAAKTRHPADIPPAFEIILPGSGGSIPEDVTASLSIGDRITGRAGELPGATALQVILRADAASRRDGARLHITLVERDGTAWSAPAAAAAQTTTVNIPLSAFTPAKWVLLPQPYPAEWSYWAEPTRRTGTLDVQRIERLQFSLRAASEAAADNEEIAAAAAIEGIFLIFDGGKEDDSVTKP